MLCVTWTPGRCLFGTKESLPAPVLAYWGLPEGTSMRTFLLVMRADLNARMIINQGADFRSLRLVRLFAHLKRQQTTCKGLSSGYRAILSLMCLHHMSLRVLSALPESITIMHHSCTEGVSACPAMPRRAWLLLAKLRLVGVTTVD